MGLIRFARNSFNRWLQVEALRRHFSSQRLVDRPCALCGSPRLRLLIRGDRDRLGIHTSQCLDCGFIMSSPFYSADAVADFYRESYRALFKGQPDPKGLAGRHSYLRERVEFYAPILAEHGVVPAAGGYLLDVGCGEGTLLRTLRERHPGVNFAGVEPTLTYADHLVQDAGIPVVDDITRLDSAHQFDAILLIHVLEHVHDPVSLLKQIGQRLRPGGKVYVDVPDVAAHSTVIDLHLAHCNHFSTHTLDSALRRSGLRPLELRAHRPPTLPPSIFAIAQFGAGLNGAGATDPDAEAYARRISAINVGPVNRLTRLLGDRLRPPSSGVPPKETD